MSRHLKCLASPTRIPLFARIKNSAVWEDQNVVLQIEAFPVSPLVLGFKRTFGRQFLNNSSAGFLSFCVEPRTLCVQEILCRERMRQGSDLQPLLKYAARAHGALPGYRKTKSPHRSRTEQAVAESLSSRRSVVRRPRERPPRAVARLVPVPRLISVARPVKVPWGIVARSIGTRRGSRRHARFLGLRLRDRRGVGRDCY